MFWCCSVLYICDRKCLKCEIKFQMKCQHKIKMGDSVHLNSYISLPFFVLSSCKIIPKHSGMLFNEVYGMKLLTCSKYLHFPILHKLHMWLCPCRSEQTHWKRSFISMHNNRLWWQWLTRDNQCRQPFFQNKFSVIPCSLPTALPPLALFAALEITVNIAEGTTWCVLFLWYMSKTEVVM